MRKTKACSFEGDTWVCEKALYPTLFESSTLFSKLAQWNLRIAAFGVNVTGGVNCAAVMFSSLTVVKWL